MWTKIRKILKKIWWTIKLLALLSAVFWGFRLSRSLPLIYSAAIALASVDIVLWFLRFRKETLLRKTAAIATVVMAALCALYAPLSMIGQGFGFWMWLFLTVMVLILCVLSAMLLMLAAWEQRPTFGEWADRAGDYAFMETDYRYPPFYSRPRWMEPDAMTDDYTGMHGEFRTNDEDRAICEDMLSDRLSNPDVDLEEQYGWENKLNYDSEGYADLEKD